MFALGFDLKVADTAAHHPKGVSQPYVYIGATRAGFGLAPVQGSLYPSQSDDLVNLFTAINALELPPWFPASVRDIRAFRVEQCSDFTQFVKT